MTSAILRMSGNIPLDIDILTSSQIGLDIIFTIYLNNFVGKLDGPLLLLELRLSIRCFTSSSDVGFIKRLFSFGFLKNLSYVVLVLTIFLSSFLPILEEKNIKLICYFSWISQIIFSFVDTVRQLRVVIIWVNYTFYSLPCFA